MLTAILRRLRISGLVGDQPELFAGGILQADGVLQNDTILGVP